VRALCAAILLACGPGTVVAPDDTGLDGLSLAALAPDALVPGSTLVVTGSSFVDAPFGASRLRLAGTFEGQAVDVRLPLRFVDYDRMDVDWGGARAAGFPADAGSFDGEASVEVESTVDGRTYRSPARAVRLTLAPTMTPALDRHGAGGLIFVNEPISVTGGGLLLGGGEGRTEAVIAGCYVLAGETACRPLGETRVAVIPAAPFDRRRGSFPFTPRIAGIRPGAFRGEVALENPGGARSQALAVEVAVGPPRVLSVDPPAASLGQYVNVRGGGFVGQEVGAPVALTVLEAQGSFLVEGGPAPVQVTLSLFPEFVSGPLVRYVLNDDDELGRRIDLRTQAGRFTGSLRPVVQYGADTVRGDATAVTVDIAHVKQVVWVRFQPAYVESLRKFGLRAADPAIRARVFEVARRDYAGVNLELRSQRPDDFALFSTVDIGGPDLNGLGYFGYDNTPGKDVDNLRLFDKIGGLNARTQEDGSPGYGGVFVESLFAFSRHPNGLAELNDGASPLFDAIFDAFRPDLGGAPVLAADVAAGIPTRSDGSGCPASSGDRQARIGCAVFVLGSLIGTTMTHEIGHSLGLAAPDGDPTQYHNRGDAVNRLMDGGSARTFAERAELAGEGPSVFCDQEMDYLRRILPSRDPEPAVERPPCD
jgi:hypothetical protein